MNDITCIVCKRPAAVELREIYLCGSCFFRETLHIRAAGSLSPTLEYLARRPEQGLADDDLRAIVERLGRDLEELRASVEREHPGPPSGLQRVAGNPAQ